MPTDRPVIAPHAARHFIGNYINGTLGAVYHGLLDISSTSSAVETGVINESELGTFSFGTKFRDVVNVGDTLLVNGEYYRVMTAPEVQNAIASLQYAEVAVQRIKTK